MGRSDNTVKNYWNFHLKFRLSSLNQNLADELKRDEKGADKKSWSEKEALDRLVSLKVRNAQSHYLSYIDERI